MKTMTKALAATVAAGALAVTSATPAVARDHDDGIDAGDIIAGAVILGGIAAVAGAIGDKDRDRYDYHDRRYRDRDYRYGKRGRYRNNGRRAVDMCVRAAEREARRAGYRFADVTEIRDVDDKKRGWRVKGRMVVEGSRGGYGYRDRGWRDARYDRRGYGRYSYGRGYDRGKFTCDVRYGRVVDLDFDDIRGLR